MNNFQKKNVAVIILSIGIILCFFGTIIGMVKIIVGNADKDVECIKSDQVILEGDGTDIVQSEEDAFNYIMDNSNAYGIDNPEETIYFDNKKEALNCQYYNFRQQYEGVPVYGNRLVVMTGNDGVVRMSSGAYKKVDENVSLVPSVTAATIVEQVRQYISKYKNKKITDVQIIGGIAENNLVIYVKGEDNSSLLAYEFDVIYMIEDTQGSYHVVADAHSGEVLTAYDNIVTVSQTINAVGIKSTEDGTNEEMNINVYKDSDKKYYMYDEERNIIVCNANKLNVRKNEQNIKDATTMIGWKDVSHMLFLSPKPTIVSSDSINEWDKKAVTLMSNLKRNYIWYENNYKIKGYDNKNSRVVSYYDDKYFYYDKDTGDRKAYGENAYSCTYSPYRPYTFLSYGYEMNVENMDLIAHEYAHSVMNAVLDTEYKGQSGAICEAYADTMGEIIEADTSWYSSAKRNIANPKGSGNPARIEDANYQETGVEPSDENDNAGVHQNSTILSHASYLMTKGTGGEKLNNLQIAKLWYSTICNIPTVNITFQEFGALMCDNAAVYTKMGILSYKQYKCVCSSLEKVGISSVGIMKKVNNKFQCALKNIYGEALDKATVEIYSYENGMVKNLEYEKVTAGDGTLGEVNLKSGEYYIKIKDNKYPNDPVYEMFIKCGMFGVKKINLVTSLRGEVVTDFAFDKDEYDIAVNEEKYIDTVYNPKGISEQYYTLEWSSSDTGKVSIDRDTGKMKGISEGTAEITAVLTNKGRMYKQKATINVTKKKRDTVLVLDCSGSMDGTPLSEMKKSAVHFCKAILASGDNQIEIISYDDYAKTSGFMSSFSELEYYINSLYAGDMTNMYDALKCAEQDLQNYGRNNSIKNIVVMSDGAPNYEEYETDGLMTDWCMAESDYNNDAYLKLAQYGNLVCSYADKLKKDYNIYSLGFFHSLHEKEKEYCSFLMKNIQKSGYYEVDKAEELQITFDDISDEVSDGSKIVIHIACPVDVFVTYGNETLSSSYTDYQDKASFGNLKRVGASNAIKVLELDSDKEYELSISGTGSGTMDYEVTYYNENDEVADTRTFENVPITADTRISANTAQSSDTELKIDSNGDGAVDSIWTAGTNTIGSETWTGGNIEECEIDKESNVEKDVGEYGDIYQIGWIVFTIICIVILLTLIIVLVIVIIKSRKQHTEEKVSSKIENIEIGIQFLDGAKKGCRIKLNHNKLFNIGKDSELSDVVIDNHFINVSKQHCAIGYSQKNNKYIVIDYSLNGTYYLKSDRRLEKGKRTLVERNTVIYLAKKDCRIKLL